MKKFLPTAGLLASIAFAALLFPQSASALTISPVRTELATDPGGVIAGEMKLYNDEGATKTYYSSFENFEASGDDGVPVFTGSSTNLSTWLSAPESITLAPGERTAISYIITVPSSAAPGGYFAAVLWSEQQPDPTGAGEVSVSSKVGTLVLFRVNGDIPVSQNSSGLRPRSVVFPTLPVEIDYGVQNDGGDRVVPEGEVKIYNTFGGEVISIPVNPSKANVLPASTRKFTVTWSDTETEEGAEAENAEASTGFVAALFDEITNPKIGRYTAVLAAEDGTEMKTSFYLIPWHVLLLLLVILLMYLAYRRLRKSLKEKQGTTRRTRK